MAVGLVRIALLCAIISACAACTCLLETGPERFCRYDIVVRGKAINRTKVIVNPHFEFDPDNHFVYTIDVQHVFAIKGASPADNKVDTVVLKTSAVGSFCGTSIRLYTDRVLFGTTRDGEFWTDMCAPNGAWGSFSKVEQRALETGLKLCGDMKQL